MLWGMGLLHLLICVCPCLSLTEQQRHLLQQQEQQLQQLQQLLASPQLTPVSAPFLLPSHTHPPPALPKLLTFKNKPPREGSKLVGLALWGLWAVRTPWGPEEVADAVTELCSPCLSLQGKVSEQGGSRSQHLSLSVMCCVCSSSERSGVTC